MKVSIDKFVIDTKNIFVISEIREYSHIVGPHNRYKSNIKPIPSSYIFNVQMIKDRIELNKSFILRLEDADVWTPEIRQHFGMTDNPEDNSKILYNIIEYVHRQLTNAWAIENEPIVYLGLTNQSINFPRDIINTKK